MWQLLTRLFRWRPTDGGHTHVTVVVAEEEARTLEQVKEQILTMKKGEKRSFRIDRIPEGQDFEDFQGWVALHKGGAILGRNYATTHLDVRIY